MNYYSEHTHVTTPGMRNRTLLLAFQKIPSCSFSFIVSIVIYKDNHSSNFLHHMWFSTYRKWNHSIVSSFPQCYTWEILPVVAYDSSLLIFIAM